MPYQLGVDLGTTFTAAAVCRPGPDGSGRAEVTSLSTRATSAASVLFLGPDGVVLIGDAAERRVLTDPERVVREFKRRIGDGTPLVVADELHHAHDLAAQMVRWVVDRVTEREGHAPDRIAVTHPASWGQHRQSLFKDGLRRFGLDDALFLTEPQAAALNYAKAERFEPGSTVAVYDLGGGTFDTAVLRKTDTDSFEILGHPEGIERLGGVDFDEAVFDHVRAGLADALDELDPTDPVVLSAVARLRRECTEAKEALSADTEVTIPVLLPGVRTQARLVRAEFEAMIRPALERTIEALVRAVRSAELAPSDLTSVLLVGGSSRIPLVTQLISQELGCPIAVDTDQNTAVALGAALAASMVKPVVDEQHAVAGFPARPAVDTVPLRVAPPAAGRRRRTIPKVIAGTVGLAAVAASAFTVLHWHGTPASGTVPNGSGMPTSGRATPSQVLATTADSWVTGPVGKEPAARTTTAPASAAAQHTDGTTSTPAPSTTPGQQPNLTIPTTTAPPVVTTTTPPTPKSSASTTVPSTLPTTSGKARSYPQPTSTTASQF
jgi:molecular chaperone DnaK